MWARTQARDRGGQGAKAAHAKPCLSWEESNTFVLSRGPPRASSRSSCGIWEAYGKHLRSRPCLRAQSFHAGGREVQDVREGLPGRCLRQGAVWSHLVKPQLEREGRLRSGAQTPSSLSCAPLPHSHSSFASAKAVLPSSLPLVPGFVHLFSHSTNTCWPHSEPGPELTLGLDSPTTQALCFPTRLPCGCCPEAQHTELCSEGILHVLYVPLYESTPDPSHLVLYRFNGGLLHLTSS